MASKAVVTTKKQGISKIKILAFTLTIVLAAVFCYYSIHTADILIADIPKPEDKAMSEEGGIPAAKLEAGIPAAKLEAGIPAAEKVIPAPSHTLSYPVHSDSVNPAVKVANDTELHTETPISKTLPYAGDDNSLISPPDSYCGIYADFLEGTVGGKLCESLSLARHKEFKSDIARVTELVKLKDTKTTKDGLLLLVQSCIMLHHVIKFTIVILIINLILYIML